MRRQERRVREEEREKGVEKEKKVVQRKEREKIEVKKTFFKHFKMQMISNQESGSKIAVNNYCICR